VEWCPYIEKDAAAVAGQHDVSGLGFSVELARRGEARLVLKVFVPSIEGV